MVVPFRGSGSWDHLVSAGIPEDKVPQVLEEIKSEIQTLSKRKIFFDDVETATCESKPGRLLTKVDVIVRGQSLFHFNSSGNPVLKRYSSKDWEPVEVLFT
jgi:hypothetical protein